MKDIVLEGRDISFSYKDRCVLKNINVKFSKNKFYGVLGPNGSGKSTLLDILLGFKSPDKGKLLLYNRDVRKLKKSEIAKKIAYVPQSYEINFPFKVDEIILMGRYPHIKRFSIPSPYDMKIVEDVEKKMDLHKLRHRPITELSGGERQRVMIARALAQNSPVYLLDEPTSNLDIKHSLKVLGLLKKKVIDESCTVICVFHNINEAATFCHELLFLKNGEVVVSGEVKNVLTKEILEEVFEVKATLYFENRLKCLQVIFSED